MINPSISYSRYTTHKYFGFFGPISHQRNARYSPCHPSIIYSGSSIAFRNSSKYTGVAQNSGCSKRILSYHIFEVRRTNLPNFEVAIHNISNTETIYHRKIRDVNTKENIEQ